MLLHSQKNPKKLHLVRILWVNYMQVNVSARHDTGDDQRIGEGLTSAARHLKTEALSLSCL